MYLFCKEWDWQFSGVVHWRSIRVLLPNFEGGCGRIRRSWELASRRIVCVSHSILGTHFFALPLVNKFVHGHGFKALKNGFLLPFSVEVDHDL
jgi:hypothetical protein